MKINTFQDIYNAVDGLLSRPAEYELFFEGRPLRMISNESLYSVKEVHIDGDEQVFSFIFSLLYTLK